MNKLKNIVFLTGTRADFGKLKPLMAILQDSETFEPHVFVTGMHLQELYGYTLIEIERSGFKNIHTFNNSTKETTMDLTLAKTIEGFSSYINQLQPDLIVVHGDRVEALAGAIVGSLNNILVAHIEGGELSGTIDELIRHSVSKLCHVHFVANSEAKKRLLQMGELPNSIFTIGSPDVDIMFSNKLPDLGEVKDYYNIDFDQYAIAMYHPVTTEIDHIERHANNFVEAILESQKNYVVIYPNNDLGSKYILEAYKKLQNNKAFRVFPSLRFEYFLTLLKNAQFVIGNSSAGVREAPYYNTPTINIGTRQQNRILNTTLINTDYKTESIKEAILNLKPTANTNKKSFGKGDSAQLFLERLKLKAFWDINHQKQFRDLI
ncbi:UDP-N-acetylglucosamine 2-epimerase [uncultured Algibacter sp.]|uniref:UDP-N-acetylglucosamine 2-epimerase n=1 Tax=uncultured Algibacter sp. TaxID=298659 RepID=UPI0030EE46E3